MVRALDCSTKSGDSDLIGDSAIYVVLDVGYQPTQLYQIGPKRLTVYVVYTTHFITLLVLPRCQH